VQARVLGVQVPPDKVEDVDDAYRTSLVPAVERHEGFGALLLLWNPDTGEALEITLWQDDDARQASEAEGGPVQQKLEELQDILGIRPTFANYQLRIMS
jgi:hypothetical protein